MTRASYINPRDDPEITSQLAEAAKYKAIACRVGEIYEVEPSIIAGICSRESRWGLALRPPGPGGTGDFVARSFPSRYREGPFPPDGLGFGRGLMQIDYDYHEFARTGNWRDPEENISYGIRLLTRYLKLLGRKSDLDEASLLRAAVAAYNAGAGRILRSIKKGLDIDYFTTGGDYSRDILSRAEFFRTHGWL